jgi:hypothetical protein
MEPDNAKGRCRRGSALRELGRHADALAEFRWCVELEPKSKQIQELFDNCQMVISFAFFSAAEI